MLANSPNSPDDMTRKNIKFVSCNFSDTTFIHMCLRVLKQWRDRIDLSALSKRCRHWSPALLAEEFRLSEEIMAKIARR